MSRNSGGKFCFGAGGKGGGSVIVLVLKVLFSFLFAFVFSDWISTCMPCKRKGTLRKKKIKIKTTETHLD